MKNSEKTILVYGLSGMPLMNLAMNAKKAGIRCIAVSDDMTGYSIEKLLSGEELAPLEPLSLPGKYALMSGFERNIGEPAFLLNQACPGIVKSVRTEHNSSWSFKELCFAIQQEQDAIAAMRKMRR